MKREDIQRPLEVLQSIERELGEFSPEQQMVIVSGILANTLCRCGPEPSRHTAVMLAGSSMEMVFDMIGRHFADAEKATAQ